MDITNRKGKVLVSHEMLKQMQQDGRNYHAFMLVLFIQHQENGFVYWGVSELFEDVPINTVPPFYSVDFSKVGDSFELKVTKI